MPIKSWDRCYGHAFRDRCVLQRKYDSITNDKELRISERLRPPGAPAFTAHARKVLNLRTTLESLKSKGWSERVLSEAERSGELKNMMIGHKYIDGENARGDDRDKYNSAEVRVQEFIDRQLNGIGTRPQKVQATFMATVAMSCASNVAGDEWRHIGPQICRQYQWPLKKNYRMMLASAPRRFGKTRFVTMFTINYALSIPGVPVYVFSTSQATSNLLRQDLQVILREAHELEFAGRRYALDKLTGDKNNQNEWRFRSPYNPELESIVYFNPGLNPNNADKHRGKGNHPRALVILEEMAFLDPRAFVNVVLPIMSMKHARVVGISSPAYDEFNFFTRLQHIKFPNSKQHVCLTVKAELSCKRCKRRNIAAWCTHYNSMLPEWINQEQQFVNRLVMKALNMEDAAKREIGGIVASMQNHAFDPKSISRLRKRRLFRAANENAPNCIGIFVDPNAGGTSELAIISMCLVSGAFVVCVLLFLIYCTRSGRRLTSY